MGAQKPGFLRKYFVVDSRFGKNPVSLVLMGRSLSGVEGSTSTPLSDQNSRSLSGVKASTSTLRLRSVTRTAVP